MKIGILLHPYGEKNPAGLARIIFELTSALVERDRENEYILYVKDEPKPRPQFPGSNWTLHVLGGGPFWLDRGFRTAPPADIVIFNTPVVPFFFRPKKTIVIALDFAYRYMKPRTMREYIQNIFLTWYHSFSLRAADMVVAISHATREDVKRLYGIADNKMKTVYCGFKKICELPAQTILVPDAFFLFAGVLKERKNVSGVVHAYALFKQKNSGEIPNLVIAGRGEGAYTAEIKRLVSSLGIQQHVSFLGYVTDQQLSFLYQHATALVFPSFIEGFGFPVLEAMNCGLPVITSNQSSLAELGADGAAILVDPHDAGSIAQAMEKIAHTGELREELRTNGRKKAEEFSWERAAHEFLEIIQSIQMKR
jgi:glycosyltransferase involved in cell wall biosynthesis